MLSRLLLAAGLAGLIGLSDGYSQAGPEPAPAPRPQKPKDEPRKPKDEPKKPKDEPKKSKRRSPSSGKTFTPPKAGELKKYDDVITKDAKTHARRLHRPPDRRQGLLRDPRRRLRQADALAGRGRQGPGRRQLGRLRSARQPTFVRCERRGNKVFLWQVSFDKRGDGKAVQAGRRFRQHGLDHRQLPGRGRGQGPLDRHQRHAAVHDRRRSTCRVKRAGRRRRAASTRTAPTSTTSRRSRPTSKSASLLTFRGGGGGGRTCGRPAPGGRRRRAAATPPSCTTAWSCCPSEPMKGRFFDPRVGYFTELVRGLRRGKQLDGANGSTSPASAWRRRTRRRTSPSRSSRSSSTSAARCPRSGGRT